MRILLLTAFFISVFLYFKKDSSVVSTGSEADLVKIQVSGPSRAEKLIVHKAPVEVITDEVSEGQSSLTEESAEVSSAEEDLEHIDEVPTVQLSDLEEGWNAELKDMLNRLEPAEGEEIHKTYMAEQEAYQAELDALMNEKQQKTSAEASLEVEQLIGQLDNKHQDRLKEIFGAHYEAVRDGYESYMEYAPQD